MKTLLCADYHIHTHKNKFKKLEDCLKVVDWTFDTALEHNIKHILLAGDFFHDREEINILTYHMAYETLERNLSRGDFNLWILLGNHDLWYFEKTNVSSVTPLRSLPGVKIIDKPQAIQIEDSKWDFIPFTHDPISAVESLRENKSDFCLGHIAIHGAILHSNTLSDVAIEHDGDMVTVSPHLFHCYKNAFFGHYHAPQILDNVSEYIGSPLQFTFGEVNQNKHIIIFDTNSGEKNYIKNDFSPRHLILEKEELDFYDLKNNYVQVNVDSADTADIIEMKKKYDALELKVKITKKEIKEHVIQDVKSILSDAEVVEKYVKEVGFENLNKDLLISIGKKTYSQIK